MRDLAGLVALTDLAGLPIVKEIPLLALIVATTVVSVAVGVRAEVATGFFARREPP